MMIEVAHDQPNHISYERMKIIRGLLAMLPDEQRDLFVQYLAATESVPSEFVEPAMTMLAIKDLERSQTQSEIQMKVLAEQNQQNLASLDEALSQLAKSIAMLDKLVQLTGSEAHPIRQFFRFATDTSVPLRIALSLWLTVLLAFMGYNLGNAGSFAVSSNSSVESYKEQLLQQAHTNNNVGAVDVLHRVYLDSPDLGAFFQSVWHL